MLVTKIKMAAVVLLAVCVTGAGAGMLTRSGGTQRPGGTGVAPAARTRSASEKDKKKPAAAEGGGGASREGKGERDGEPRARPRIQGLFRKASAADQTITVALRKPEPQGLTDQSFRVAKDVTVVIDGRPGKLSDLPAGTPVGLFLSPDKKIVVGVRADGPTESGTVKAVDPAKRTLTLDGGERGDRTFPLAPNTPILLSRGNGSPALALQPADLKPGTSVELQRALKGGAVLQVQVFPPEVRGERNAVRGPDGAGAFQKFDAAANTITVGFREKSDRIVFKTYKLADGVKVRVDDGKTVPVSELAEGVAVRVYLSEDGTRLISLRAIRPLVTAQVKAVDPAGRTVTLTAGGQDQTLKVPPEAVIVINSQRSDLTHLRVGAQVQAHLGLDKKSVVRLVVVSGKKKGRRQDDEPPERADIAGTMKALDAEEGTVTFLEDADNPNGRILNLTRTVKVYIDGKEGKLAGLAPGMMVRAKLDRAREYVIWLWAEGPAQRDVVYAVDSARGTITLGREKKNYTLDLAKDVRILLPSGEDDDQDRLLKPEELKPGQWILFRLSVDRKRVVHITVTRVKK